jgi:hypothetical protein
MTAAVRRFIPHFAATFARDPGLVHDQMAGNECSGAKRDLYRSKEFDETIEGLRAGNPAAAVSAFTD